MKRILVTGATAPIGRALVQSLLHDPRVEFVLAAGIESEALAVPGNQRDRFEYTSFDLSHPREVRQLLFGPAKAHDIDTIVHGPLHRRATEGGSKIHAIDVESTREMLHLAQRHPTLRHFVFRSSGQIYRMRADVPSVIDEEQPLDLSPRAPQWVRDRVEADLIACTHLGIDPLRIAILRCAECLSPGTGSQLFDYLHSRLGFRAIGFDPMLNFLTTGDLVRALSLAIHSTRQGIFNIPGGDTLPLSEAVARWGQYNVPVPARMLGPIYRMRSRLLGTDFRWDMNQSRFHFSAVLSGARAEEVLGYSPTERIAWPAYIEDHAPMPLQ